MIKTFTCIICPKGCEIEADFNPQTKVISKLCGASCNKGNDYIKQEITAPQRTIQSSVKINNGELPLTSVKTSDFIPKDSIFEIMKVIQNIRLDAPVVKGFIAYKNILDLNVDIIVTKTINRNRN